MKMASEILSFTKENSDVKSFYFSWFLNSKGHVVLRQAETKLIVMAYFATIRAWYSVFLGP